jgi:hypothetical protein
MPVPAMLQIRTRCALTRKTAQNIIERSLPNKINTVKALRNAVTAQRLKPGIRQRVRARHTQQPL